jgi:hypothetical protein
MSVLRTFFRHCPSCGRRFEIRLISKGEVSDEGGTWMASRSAAGMSGRRESNVMLEGERPVTVEVSETEEVKDFKYNYKCKHCGHEWSEERFKTTERAGNPNYKGD